MAENKHIAGKEKTAVAVAYNPGEVAPKILAVGKGEVAERIIETAKENVFRFIRITSWRRPYPDFRSGIRFRRNSMRWSRRSLSLWTIWTA